MSPSDRPHDLLTLAEKDYGAAKILAHADDPQTDAAGGEIVESVVSPEGH